MSAPRKERDRRGTEIVPKTPPINLSSSGLDVIDKGGTQIRASLLLDSALSLVLDIFYRVDSSITISTVSGIRPPRLCHNHPGSCLLAR